MGLETAGSSCAFWVKTVTTSWYITEAPQVLVRKPEKVLQFRFDFPMSTASPICLSLLQTVLASVKKRTEQVWKGYEKMEQHKVDWNYLIYSQWINEILYPMLYPLFSIDQLKKMNRKQIVKSASAVRSIWLTNKRTGQANGIYARKKP